MAAAQIILLMRDVINVKIVQVIGNLEQVDGGVR